MVYLGIRYFICLLSAASIVRATIGQIEAQLNSVAVNSVNWEQLLDEFPTTGASVSEVLVRTRHFVLLRSAYTVNTWVKTSPVTSLVK